ncbi:preprotein translocase subunit SecD, partial [Methanosarcinales archaeon]
MKGEIFKDVRVVALILLVLASIIAIHPVYSTTPEPHFGSNLEYGIELVGGTSIQLKLEGVLVDINFDRDKVFSALMEDLLNNTITITSSDDESITFTTPASVTQEEMTNLGLGNATVSPFEGGSRVTIETTPQTIMSTYLQKQLDTEVVYTRYKDHWVYEIRKEVEKEDLESLLAKVGAKIALDEEGKEIFIEGVTPQTLDVTKQVIDDKINTIGLKDIHTRTVGNKYILVDLPGADI